MTSHSSLICRCVALSSDGQLLLGGFGPKIRWGMMRDPGSQALRIWNLNTQELIDTIHVEDPIQTIVPTPNAQTLIIRKADGSVTFLDFKTSQRLGSLQAPSFHFYGSSLSQNREVIAGIDLNQATITVWDLRANQVINSFRLKGLTCAHLSLDGTILVAGNETDEGGIIKVWDVYSGREMHSLVAAKYTPRDFNPYSDAGGDEKRGVSNVSISPDNQMVLFITKIHSQVEVWDLNAERTWNLSAQTLGDFSSDGELVVNVCRQIFEPRTGKHLQRIGNRSLIVRSVAVSQDGRILASLTWSGGFNQIEVNNLETKTKIGVFAKEKI